MNRNQALKRHFDERAIRRKINIVKGIYNEENLFAPKKDVNCHSYSKGKIHCSCPMCASKTKTNGFKHSDKVRMMKGLVD